MIGWLVILIKNELILRWKNVIGFVGRWDGGKDWRIKF